MISYPDATFAANKKRSYRVRVRPGDQVRFLTGIVRSNGRVKAGATGTVRSETNAGFRGIVCSVVVGDKVFVDVSTGILEKIAVLEVAA